MKRTAILLILLSTIWSCKNRSEKQGPLVLTYTVENAGKPSTASFPAKVEAPRTSNLAFKVSGTIQAIYVKQGSKIKVGEPLARLDDRDYALQLAATRAEYNQIKAEVDRVIALYEVGAVSANDYDKARYGLEQITQKLRHHTDQLSDCTIRAPYNAYVNDIPFRAGETVMAGIPVISIMGQGNAKLTTAFPSNIVARSDEFESFTAEFSIMPGKDFPVKLENLSHGANKLQLFDAKFSFEDNTEEISPGMTATLRIKFRQNKDEGFLVPVHSLSRYGNESCVFVLDKESSTVKRTVVEIMSLNNDGEALIRGLDAGTIIVSAGVNKLSDGQKVRPVPEKSSTNPGGLL